MISKKTVIVLGAGASKPYGFPTGPELVYEICEKLRDSRGGTTRLLRDAGAKAEEIERLKDGLRRAQLYSIDEFLEHRTDLFNVGKSAVAAMLIPKEYSSLGHLFDLKKKDHWYRLFRNSLRSSFKAFVQNQIKVITFNYDRSFEFYLLESLCNSYQKSPEECSAILEAIPIVHIYGSLGPLPWQSPSDEALPYGHASATPDLVVSASHEIKVLQEGRGEVEKRFKLAHEWLNWADRVVFLGFGFHPDNVRRLNLRGLRQDQERKGTCLALPLGLRERAVSCTHWAAPKAIDPIFAIDFPDPKADCYTFLHDYVALS
jgi:hypothetical protein